jgi:hypothetical protein
MLCPREMETDSQGVWGPLVLPLADGALVLATGAEKTLISFWAGAAEGGGSTEADPTKAGSSLGAVWTAEVSVSCMGSGCASDMLRYQCGF